MGFRWVYVVLVLAAVAAAETSVKIVVSFPAYDKILREAFPDAEVILLTKNATGDPHAYQLTVADLELLYSLTDRDVIVSSMHAPFELKIAELAEEGKIKAKLIDVTKLQSYLTWDGELVKLEREHHHEHHGHEGHEEEHEGVNMHDHGLYPVNVFKLVQAVSEAAGLQPSPHFVEKLRQLNATYGGKFGGRAVAVTPAAQYLLHWLGYRDIVVFIKEPGLPPTPQDLQKALQYAREGAPVVAAVVRGEALRVVDQFRQKAEEAGIQPRIIIADFSKDYIATLEEAAKEIAALQSAPQTAARDSASQAAVRTDAPQTAAAAEAAQGIVGVVVLIAILAVAAALLLLRRKKK